MDPQILAQLQANILFWLIIALFAWQGYQRGLWSELVKMGFIVVGFLVNKPDLLGNTLVQAVNGFWLALQFLIHGGFQAIVSGNFNADTLASIFEEINQLPPLIPKNNAELAMFLAMLFLILVGYAVSKLFKVAYPGLGLVAGAVNGFLLSYIFLPKLPDEPPFKLTDLSLAGILKQLTALILHLFDLLVKLIASLFQFLFDIFGHWTIPILILVAIILVLTSLTPARKSGGGGGGS